MKILDIISSAKKKKKKIIVIKTFTATTVEGDSQIS